jgi:hypothetical protein
MRAALVRTASTSRNTGKVPPGGIGRHTERKISCTGDCARFPDEGFGPDTIVEAGTSASGALEAGVYLRRDQLHLGFVARGDITGPVYAVTLGPVLGLEF